MKPTYPESQSIASESDINDGHPSDGPSAGPSEESPRESFWERLRRWFDNCWSSFKNRLASVSEAARKVCSVIKDAVLGIMSSIWSFFL
jgi:hypothetical protein